MSATLATLDRPVRAAVSRLKVARPVVPHRRFAFIDALRGLAALAVVFHHLDRFGPLWQPASYLIPEIVSTVFENARGGVGRGRGFMVRLSKENLQTLPLLIQSRFGLGSDSKGRL